MSKLDDLINELCPDGVEYKKLAGLAEIGTGSSNTNEELENGKYPFYVRSQEVRRIDSYEFDEKAIITAGDGVGVGKVFHLANGKYALHQRAYRIHSYNEDVLKSEFLFHFMKATFYDYITKNQYKASVQSIRRPMLNNYEIPVPPLEIQNEIVRILDNFTELEEELEEELEARRKQYEYYRDSLFVNMKIEKTLKIKDISDMVTVGIANSATHAYTDKGIIMFRNQNIKENILDDSDLIYISEEFESKYKNKRLKANDILVSRTGYPGQACLVPSKYENCQTFTTLILRLKQDIEVLPKYICYYINSKHGKKYVSKVKTGAAQENFNAGSLEEMPVIIPTLNEQKRIVDILDRFEALCNDITSGLPAEIEARHKQYEYYRDKLLTFKRKEG